VLSTLTTAISTAATPTSGAACAKVRAVTSISAVGCRIANAAAMKPVNSSAWITKVTTLTRTPTTTILPTCPRVRDQDSNSRK
jgi:hypothetical protein